MDEVKLVSKRGGRRPNTGGARIGAGRPRVKGTVDECICELVYPCVVVAWQNEWTRSNPFDAHWVVHMSKTNIRRTYGEDGLRLFTSYFEEKKKGGYSRTTGQAFPTRWEVKWSQYKMVQFLLKEMGHDIKDIMSLIVKFPPDAFIQRVKDADARKKAKGQVNELPPTV
jgi:hypothetical protein